MKKLTKSAWAIIGLFFSTFAILLFNAGRYLPFISDDSLIPLRYAHRLLEGRGLTWTDGRPVEGYSNLLWVLLVAGLGRCGVDLIDATRILGIVGMAVILLLMVCWYVRRNDFSDIWFSLTIGLLFFSLGAPIAVWTIGGLEPSLYGALIAISILLMFLIVESKNKEKNKILWLSFVLGSSCITRPDGLIFAIAGAISLFFVGRFHGGLRSRVNSLLVLLFPVLFCAGQLIFRMHYYGELLPNTALVKITPSYHHFLNGVRYLYHGSKALFPFSFLAIVSIFALLFLPRSRGKGIYLLIIAIMWSGYIVFIGGDYCPAYRHFVPLMVVFAFALIEGAHAAVKYLKSLSHRRYYFILIALGFISFVPYMYILFTEIENRAAIDERWEWEGKEIGVCLKAAFSAQQPLLAVTAAGCIPYWSELPALDMLGLNDYYLPRHRPADIGNGVLGHELGNGRYVLSRKPDIIIFCVGTTPVLRSGYEMDSLPEFHKMYTPIKLLIHRGKTMAISYFNKYSAKIGILRSSTQIVIPGYLFSGENTVAYLNKANKLVAEIKNGQPVSVMFDSESSQDWSVEIKASEPDKVRCELTRDGASISIILFSKGAKPIEIEEVILRRKS